MRATIRDSFVGQVINAVTNGRLLPYPEEEPGFVLPPQYRQHDKGSSPLPRPRPGVMGETPVSEVPTPCHTPVTGEGDANPNLVTWYGPENPENPMNWSTGKKCWLTGTIMLLTTSIYMGSSIWAPAIEQGAEYFHVGLVASTLGISLFVLGYATGPLFLSPITEIPAIGRTSPYIVTLLVYCVLQLPNALVTNFPGFCVLRFLSGFVGSPALATGGASLSDAFAPHKLPYAMALYNLAAASAPGLGPILSGFAVDVLGWRWAFWEMLLLSAGSLIILSFTMPETSADTILCRRAARLRRLTGNPHLRSASEIAQSHLSARELLIQALIRPLYMTVTEPIIIAINIYIGLLYAVLYSFFESFPIVFAEGYGWSLGVSELPFAGILVGEIAGLGVYMWWNRVAYEGMCKRVHGHIEPEKTLTMSLPGAVVLPVAIFWFGWTANRTHWLSPVFAAGLFGFVIDWLFAPFLTYLTYAYPQYAASALASNDFVRSLFGAGMPLASQPLFHNLGVAWGNTILGCCGVLFVPLPWILIRSGPWLRERSPMAVHDKEILAARIAADEAERAGVASMAGVGGEGGV
ncbi:hypothetical protein JCM24511_01029 [Saitozyma sp. JCM 24511]|nr:hypothetical protein JCM24511_01029 [Saitozyma sp. JCM 24511]